MRAAFASWENRIAPVFDVTRRVHLVEAEGGRILTETPELLAEATVQKALRLAQLGVRTLICGAISRPLQAQVEALGIQVVPFVVGDLDEVVRAWMDGRLDESCFAMPGCRGRRPRRRRGCDQEEFVMRGSGQGGGRGMGGGRGQGGGRGMGRDSRGGRSGGRRQGAGGGVAAGPPLDPNDRCRCPACGYESPHDAGMPCMNRKCPQCGTGLVRG